MRFVASKFPEKPRLPHALALAALCGGLLACSGSIGAYGGADGPDDDANVGGGPGEGGQGGGGGEGTGSASCQQQPGEPTIRRLTSEELGRSLKALLGRDLSVRWPQDELVAGYPSARDNLVLEPHARSLYTDLLPELRKLVTTNRSSLSSACAAADSKCASSLVDGFAARAWRRPLGNDEKSSLLSFYDQANRELGDANEATANLLLAILSSPHFLYRSEMGGAESGGVRKLTSREIGSALSFFFLGQPPDVTLLSKIEADGLRQEGDILAEIERLQETPAHAAWMARFFQRWTHVQDLAKRDHALDKFPDATAAYKKEAEEAFVRQLVDLIERPDATYEELVSSKKFVAGPLTAKAYANGSAPTDLSSMEAADGRRGLFMTVAFLSQYSKPDRPSSIERAKFFVDSALCLQLPGIPADALQREFTPDPKKSPRQNFEAFTSGSACSGCHQMLNPIGFSFDKYGPDGQRQKELDGFAIDTSGTISGSGDLDGALEDPEEIVLKLAASRQARACFIRQWFRFANGRQEADLDDCTVSRMVEAMEKGGDALMTFARNYFTSRNFLYRQTREAP